MFPVNHLTGAKTKLVNSEMKSVGRMSSLLLQSAYNLLIFSIYYKP